MLINWAGLRKFNEGLAVFEKGLVDEVECDDRTVRGCITYGTRQLRSAFRILADGTADSECPCYDNRERGIICSHVIAIGLALIREQNDPELLERRAEEARRAARLAQYGEESYLRRVASDAPGAVAARLVLTLPDGWTDGVAAGRIPLECAVEFNGRRHAMEAVPASARLAFTAKDEAVLFVLEDIAEGPVRSRIEARTADFINLLNLCTGRSLYDARGEPIPVGAMRLGSKLLVALDRETGELTVAIKTPLPSGTLFDEPVHLVARRKGWVFGAGQCWPLEQVLPEPMQGIYTAPMRVPRESVPRFLQNELPALAARLPVETDVTLDLFAIEPARPSFRLHVKGSEASLSAVLYAQYGPLSMVAGKADPAGHFAIPDPADILRYWTRNPEAEREAMEYLGTKGFAGHRGDLLSPVIGCREVTNFLARDLPVLNRLGWKVEVQGKAQEFLDKAVYATPVVRIQPDAQENRWFDVQFSFEDTKGRSLSQAEIQRALMKGDSFIERDGGTILFDADAIHAVRDVFEDCASGEGKDPGSFRLSSIYASYVKSSLDALDGVDVEDEPTWRKAAARQAEHVTLEPVRLSKPMQGLLRDYQKEGVSWLRFLEQSGFCGILADEMGLGKTLQTLAWLELERSLPEARGRFAMVVCPTSLVDNWAEEAARFVPGLRVLVLSGQDRHERWNELDQADLVITSYALMRRDVDRYVEREISVLILDEAQHIKNRSTQNAQAAKRLRAHHRLVLTGTPIENSVSDLWSIMDFLMQGYLGSHEQFRRRYELPIAANGPEGELAQTRLRRKLQPFLLRRLKRDVARELPPKIERVAYCTLTGDQQGVYKELLASSRKRIADMVAEKGFQASRMEVLKTLLRLRQTCCHLGLLKMPGLESAYPSAKMDLLFELLDEALDGGHRVLLFSQFVSMLHLLREELKRRELSFCYLDGATKDRMAVVKEFNTNRSIPLFLISLKAGGTGLNLTGADMVVHFDPWWNPAVEDQASDRAYRIGQKRTVYTVKLITRDTVEEKVLAMQKRKQTVIDATLAADETILGRMNWNDIRELLDL